MSEEWYWEWAWKRCDSKRVGATAFAIPTLPSAELRSGVRGDLEVEASASESASAGRCRSFFRSMLVRVPGSPSTGVGTPGGSLHTVLGAFGGLDFAAVGLFPLAGGRLEPLPVATMAAPRAQVEDQGEIQSIRSGTDEPAVAGPYTYTV